MRWSRIVREWGSTADERARRFPCDDVLPRCDDACFRAVTVHAAPATLFRWLCQMRVAPYSYDWIDNLGRQSPRAWTPGLAALAPGQAFMKIFDLVAFEPDVQITLRLRRPGLFPPMAVTYAIASASSGGASGDGRTDGRGDRRGESACRLIVKLVWMQRPGIRDRIAGHAFPWLDWIMMRRQLLNLKSLAEATDSLARRGATTGPVRD